MMSLNSRLRVFVPHHVRRMRKSGVTWILGLLIR